ncbi:MAG: [FeFe] hydrogenase H-cluster radical SAM maturase HydE [Ruminococcaceae bacterium]|nr:[FeFe] hydrogenase H-cluster radical SAM maturase HydE [Oscillospiraceae bacterium]
MDILSMNKAELKGIIVANKFEASKALLDEAFEIRKLYYGNKVYVRGLIEISNYCRNNCFYCGIRKGNGNVNRYRLTEDEILLCCKKGYELGLRTFVMQGGEDEFYDDDKMCRIISSIKDKYSDCAVTLSLGEKDKETYKRYKNAGADRYLLRHETASVKHYKKLHPREMSLENRKKCLYDLKELGFQVGAGFMVGSPFQTEENLAEDLLFLKELQPQMVGIGPFIPHCDTPFREYEAGALELTITMVALTRILLPKCLLPATTALGTISKNGREKGFMAGANVVMPNLSPTELRKDYALYNDKAYTGDEAVESIKNISEKIKRIGLEIDFSRGDNVDFVEN